MKGSTQYHLRPVQINSSVKELHGECDRTLEVYIKIPPPLPNWEFWGIWLFDRTLYSIWHWRCAVTRSVSNQLLGRVSLIFNEFNSVMLISVWKQDTSSRMPLVLPFSTSQMMKGCPNYHHSLTFYVVYILENPNPCLFRNYLQLWGCFTYSFCSCRSRNV